MSGFTNQRFADPDDAPGTVVGWSMTSFLSLERVALFDGVSAERFDWSGWRAALEPAEPAFFGSEAFGFEAFESGWDNEAWSPAFPDNATPAPFGAGPVEAFVDGWASSSFVWGAGDVSLTSAAFSGQPRESFGGGWAADSFAWTLDLITTELAATETFAGWTLMESY